MALHLELKCPVDVRALDNAPLAFRYHALEGRPRVVRDQEFLDETRARTWDEYFDFLPFARPRAHGAAGQDGAVPRRYLRVLR